ncbi:hypothetical protein GOSPT_059_00680 [Gordonia sputi NBRC 100414]|uniref:Uncharacterized protein n=1 Tax=Gordonia sputi NBRC 100414 TaxID=1089453 RepID=H5U0E8_9ACTN|nr:hypothetical protein GOSPT_059_00680 [Gordonia sputi NBRC 100414]
MTGTARGHDREHGDQCRSGDGRLHRHTSRSAPPHCSPGNIACGPIPLDPNACIPVAYIRVTEMPVARIPVVIAAFGLVTVAPHAASSMSYAAQRASPRAMALVATLARRGSDKQHIRRDRAKVLRARRFHAHTHGIEEWVRD